MQDAAEQGFVAEQLGKSEDLDKALGVARAEASAGLRSGRPYTQGDARRKRLEEEMQQQVIWPEVLVVPVGRVPTRHAKYDVRLRNSSLRAVQAMHTMLSRMVMFTCTCCRERFPTFHPAYEPPEWLDLEVLKRGASDAAVCNVEVATWDDLPPALDAFPEDLLVATLGHCFGNDILLDDIVGRARRADHDIRFLQSLQRI